MLTDHFRMLTRYNAWANRRVYDAAAALPEADYRRPRPCAFFTSIHGTLNHLLVVDRLWLARIEGAIHGIESLDQILHDDLAALRRAQAASDAHLIELADGLGEADLAGERDYIMLSAPGMRSSAVHDILATLFNHQTHHRGQVHAMLKETPVPPPPLDIIDFLADAGVQSIRV